MTSQSALGQERFVRQMRVVGLVLATLYVARYFTTWSTADTWTLLDGIDLAIHEAGHLVFMPFGEFMMVLGGSLFQILVPAIFAAYFAKTRQWFSALFVLVWVGQSCFNLSYYIADARARELPLLSGDPTSHDWTWLLIKTNMLKHDTSIGNAVRMFGMLMIVAGIGGGFYLTFRKQNEPLRSFAATRPVVTRGMRDT